jgi:hypothetical protein
LTLLVDPLVEAQQAPSTLTSISDQAFRGCTTLDSVDFSGCTTLTSIGYAAFYGCTSLVIIDLSDCTSLSTIVSPGYYGGGVFANCTLLSTVDLPNSLTSIGESAFNSCTSLATLISRNAAPPSLGLGVLNGTPVGLLIYVPDTSVDTYKTANRWSDHASKIKPLSELPPS